MSVPTRRPLLPQELRNALYILFGLAFCTVAYNQYLIPNRIAAGGFTGIGQLVNRLCGMNIGLVSLILNVPLFAVSLRRMGLRFGLRSLTAMLLLNLLIDYVPLPIATDDLLLATVYGAVLSGIGFGLILRGSCTTGGTDMLASLVHRLLPSIRVSVGIFIVDGLVILASAFVFDRTAAMYALICAFLCNLMVDLVLEGPNSARSFFIISDRSEEISARILEELERGVTGLKGRGMFSDTDKNVLLCVVSRFECLRLRRIVFSVDPKAFMISTKVHEVIGEGFEEK